MLPMSENLSSLVGRAEGGAAESALQRLIEAARSGPLDAAAVRRVADECGLPAAAVHGVARAYSDLAFPGTERVRVCRGTACFAASRGRSPGWFESATGLALGEQREGEALDAVHCLGLCHSAPAARVGDRQAAGFGEEDVAGLLGGEVFLPGTPALAALGEPVVLGRCISGGAAGLEAARAMGAWAGLAEAVAELTPEGIVGLVEASGLRGRGGAAYPTGTKWRAAFAAPGDPVVVANADEGDPGSYVDKTIMEMDPHSILEGMAAAGLATGATAGLIFVRGEYPDAAAAMELAAAEATAAGFLGPDVMGTGLGFEVTVVRGAGSYVSGEESALMQALEGLRPDPRLRPPYPAERGYLGRPTVVDNAETLANVPWILREGAEAYAALGSDRSNGTKALCVDGQFARPGVYEVEFGTPLRVVLEDLAGGLAGGATARGYLVGGPLGSVVAADAVDLEVGFDAFSDAGARLGHGSVVALPIDLPPRSLLGHLLRFGAEESCGKCMPCRLGSRRALEAAERLAGGDREEREAALAEIEELLSTMGTASLCGHGAGVPGPVRDLLALWREEVLA